MLRNRIIFGILWVLSVVGISFYGGPVSYGLFLMLTAIPIISLSYLLYVYFTYRIYQELGAKNITANQSVPYYVTLQNEKHILFTSIRVRFYSTFSEIEGLGDDNEYELGPKEGIRLETKLICRYRGEYEVGVKRIIITDLFRLIRISFDNPEPLLAVVKPEMPKEGPKQEFIISEEITIGENNKNTPDVTMREYMAGDDIRRINWKASARADRLYTRNETGEEKRGILLIPDTCRYTDDEYTYIPVENETLKAVLSISMYYVRLNIPVRLAALQRGGKLLQATAYSEKGFEDYYEEVAGIVFDREMSAEKIGGSIVASGIADSESNIILISGEVNDTTRLLSDYFERAGKRIKLYITEKG